MNGTKNKLKEVQNIFDTTRRELELVKFSEKEFKKVYHYNIMLSEQFLDIADEEHKRIETKLELGKMGKEEFSDCIKALHHAVNDIHGIIITLATSMTMFTKMHTKETNIDSLPERYEFIKTAIEKKEKS